MARKPPKLSVKQSPAVLINENDRDWLDEEEAEDAGYPISEYDLTSTPNDFNIMTIFSFIESGAVKIPAFQRNYVWDIKRASKLIESIIIGLPIPQIFLYEEARNSFLVMDGQQRLMSIYYFIKQRFPRKEKRADLRRIFDREGKVPDKYFHDDRYFTKFDLKLPSGPGNQKNRFAGLNYATLGEYKAPFELRAIRNVIVKQNSPPDDDSSVHEIFNRLNSGSMNLTPQEIRSSLYHSDFYAMLRRVNLSPGWRAILGLKDPDLHMKDIEILLRSFAMLLKGDQYKGAMARFLDRFSIDAKRLPSDQIRYLERLFLSFVRATIHLPGNAFHSEIGKFNISVFESVYAAVCAAPLQRQGLVEKLIDPDGIAKLRADKKFQKASQRQTTNTLNVRTRLTRAKKILGTY